MTRLDWDRPKVYTQRYATAKQRAYLRRLIKTTDLTAARRQTYTKALNKELTLERAADLIATLATLPERKH